jgi:hypothetical protein
VKACVKGGVLGANTLVWHEGEQVKAHVKGNATIVALRRASIDVYREEPGVCNRPTFFSNFESIHAAHLALDPESPAAKGLDPEQYDRALRLKISVQVHGAQRRNGIWDEGRMRCITKGIKRGRYTYHCRMASRSKEFIKYYDKWDAYHALQRQTDRGGEKRKRVSDCNWPELIARYKTRDNALFHLMDEDDEPWQVPCPPYHPEW